MASKLPFITLTDTTNFELKKRTRIRVRFDESLSGLHQECMISRKEGNVVIVTLREYSGTRFKLRIRLVDKTATLFSPDFSWLPNSEDMVEIVINRIAEMLNTRRSMRGCRVTRKRENTGGVAAKGLSNNH